MSEKKTQGKTPTVLIIRDGWGHNPNADHDEVNAVKLANTPTADEIAAAYPKSLIATCCEDVGLPEGTMGNSEVGHQNIGAGRIVDQESVRITKTIRLGNLETVPAIDAAMQHAKDKGTKLHLLGIASDAGVHGQLEHLYGLMKYAKKVGVENVCIHAITDGRDTPPNSGLGYVADIEAKCAEIGVGRVASVVGRFYAMDRDNRWERVEQAYNLLTGRGEFPNFSSGEAAVADYDANPTDSNRRGDEFVTTRTVGDSSASRVEDGDALIFYNYRGDRPREITKAFVFDDFDGFDRGKKLDLMFVTMTAYETGLPVEVAFPKPPKMSNILGQVISDRGLTQFRCAETEKYPHVTFFFNDYRDDPFPGEDREIVQSPKDVSTYDQKPEMSAKGVGDVTAEAIRSGKYDLVVVNFANGDMVGHTGSLQAAIDACQVTDSQVKKVLEATKEMNGRAIVTADHGNAEQMTLDGKKDGPPHTAHTLFKVEVVVVSDDHKGKTLREGGRLADIAPTLLDLMGQEKPAEMTGESLLQA